MDWKHFFFAFSGRATRFDFWVRYTLVYIGLMIAVSIVYAGIMSLIDAMGPGTGATILGGIAAFGMMVVTILLFWITLAVYVRRLHDRNRSGWFMLIMFIPLVGPIWLFIELGFLRGTEGDNRFGPDPLGSGREVAEVFS